MAIKTTAKQRRQWRVRKVIKKATDKNGRPRLSVHRTDRHIYAQIICDVRGVTLAAASTLDEGLRKEIKSGANKDAAAAVGKRVAELAKKAGIEEVAFDRGSFVYHGRIQALADAAREAGLSF